MRTRSLKPGFFTNETLADLGPLTRLLFAGLWCIADRDGRIEDRPKRIKALVLPFDQCDVNSMLDELSAGRFIIRYEADNLHVIQILAFRRHQRPHKDELCYDLPPPPEVSGSFAKPSDPIGGKPALSSIFYKGASIPSPSIATASPSRHNDELARPSGSTSPEQPATDSQPDKSRATASRTAKPTSTRPRDQLFDAVAEITGSDPKTSGSFIGRVVSALRKSDPPYTPDEVRRLPDVLAAQNWSTPLTLGTIEKYIGWVRNPPKKVRSPPAPADPMAGHREYMERRKQQNGDRESIT